MTTFPEVRVESVRSPLVAVTLLAPVPSREKVVPASMSMASEVSRSRLAESYIYYLTSSGDEEGTSSRV